MKVRFAVAAALVAASFVAAEVSAQTAQAPTMQPILAGKKLTPPIRGTADVDYVKPVTTRKGAEVITKIQVKNTSNAPIPRLTITETWYDAGGASVGGGKGAINGLLQPGEVQTIVIETPYNAKMKANNYNFSHANGTIKPHKVAKMGDEKEPAAKPASATKPAAKKK